MANLIDRQEALEGLYDVFFDKVLDVIRKLPSANCQQVTGKLDCISRQQAIDALHMHLMYRMGTDSNKKRLDEWINNLPSADRPQGWVDKAISIIDAMQKEGIIDYEQAWEFRMRARMKGADDE